MTLGHIPEDPELRALWAELGHLPEVTGAAPESADRIATVLRQHVANNRNQRTGSKLKTSSLAAAMLAGLLVGGLGGFAFGKRMAPAVNVPVATVEPTGNVYLLLLHERKGAVDQFTPFQLDSVVNEYRAWAGRLSVDNQLVNAEKLRDDKGRWLAPHGVVTASPIDAGDVISGFFLIRAANYDEAIRIAKGSPHLKYGGHIEIREIERTGP